MDGNSGSPRCIKPSGWCAGYGGNDWGAVVETSIDVEGCAGAASTLNILSYGEVNWYSLMTTDVSIVPG